MPRYNLDGADLRTVSLRVYDRFGGSTDTHIGRLALELARLSIWFAVEPEPDDWYVVTVKYDAENKLRDLVNTVQFLAVEEVND
jgi:hypothetical protein